MRFTRASRLSIVSGMAGLLGLTLAADQLSVSGESTIDEVATSRKVDLVATVDGSRAAVLGGPGDLRLKSFRLVDNGDNDGYADTNETVEMYVTLVNRSGVEITNVVASVTSTSLQIGCITVPTVSFGTMASLETKESLTPFRFSVAAEAFEESSLARFALTVQADQFPQTTRALTILIELDLDAVGGGANIGYVESFESGSRTNFLSFASTEADIDFNRHSLALSDGYRCQYHDPDGPNSNSPGRPYCFLGFQNEPDNGYDWHIHSGGAADNNVGRAYVGTRSLHWGVHLAQGAKRDTTRLKQLEGVRSLNAIMLPVNAPGDLSFKHQVSLLDDRYPTVDVGETMDRAVVAVQLATSATGTAFGDWIKIYPYENQYDAQGSDNFVSCQFDPTDDGNDEDDFFDPSDPFRRLGPSSTCFPEFVFAFAGDTDYHNAPGNMALLGRGNLDGPGLRGAIDRGTWVEPKFDLSPFRGRRIRLRFLVSSFENLDNVTVGANLLTQDSTIDDGWYIDDVRIPSALQTPVFLTADTRANAGLSECCVGGTPPNAFDGLVLAGGAGAPTQLTWPTQPDTSSYDVTRGSLDSLRSSSGDFATATDACLADNVLTRTVDDAAEPPPGSGFWYLVRANNCGGPGTYDELTGQQPDGRDIEIEAAAAACP